MTVVSGSTNWLCPMRRHTFLIVILALQMSSALANQAIESVQSLVAEQEQAPAPELVVNADELSPSGDRASTEIEASTEPEKSTASSGPVVGYVPEVALKSHFDLVASGPSQADRLYAEALVAEQALDFEQAIMLVEQALAVDDEHQPCLLLGARIDVRLGKAEAAIEVLETLTAATKANWEIWFWLGSARLLRGELTPAALALDEALARDGDVAEIWIQRALVEQQRGDHRTAIQLLGIASELAPEHPQVLLNLAYSSEALGYVEDARRAYRKFLSRAHQGAVSNLTRFAVIKHLSQPTGMDSIAEDMPALELGESDEDGV